MNLNQNTVNKLKMNFKFFVEYIGDGRLSSGGPPVCHLWHKIIVILIVHRVKIMVNFEHYQNFL